MPDEKRKPGTSGSASIIHISDLHFGKIEDRVLESLKSELNRLQPDLAIISGDFTMRARKREFLAARQFLDELSCEWRAVPGNHDIPAYNLKRRLLTPFARYRQHISPDLAPRFETPLFAAYGINSARRMSWNTFDWSRGRINLGQLQTMKTWFSKIPESKVRIVFAHHPFALPPQSMKRGAVGRLSFATKAFQEANVSLVLAGHLHQSYWSNIELETSANNDGRPLLAVQASTASSTRLKGEPNAYNLIEISERQLRLTLKSWDGDRFIATQQRSHPTR